MANDTREAGSQEAVELVNGLDSKNVYTVYSGKTHACACGCAGNYRYNPALVEFASKNRGYQVAPEEVNQNQVDKVVRYLQAHAHEVEVLVSDKEYIFEVERNETHCYRAYVSRA